jgi:hypothetical protein
MEARKFVRVQGKMVNLNAIAYVDFLESGRAMILVSGLTQEKQNISIDPKEAADLKRVLEGFTV